MSTSWLYMYKYEHRRAERRARPSTHLTKSECVVRGATGGGIWRHRGTHHAQTNHTELPSRRSSTSTGAKQGTPRDRGEVGVPRAGASARTFEREEMRRRGVWVPTHNAAAT